MTIDRDGARFYASLRILAAALCLFATVSIARAGGAPWTLVDEHWYAVEIAGHQSGWASTIIHEDGERYRTESVMRLGMGRGEARVEIGLTSMFIESRDGRPLRMRVRQEMSQTPVETEWEFGDDSITQTSRHEGREIVLQMPPPEGVWLTPRAVQRYVLERMRSGANEITYRTLDPQGGLRPVSVRSVRVRGNGGNSQHEVDGRSIPVTVWKTTSDIMPIVATERWSSDGYMVYQELASGFGKLVMRRVSRDEALAAVDGDGPELLAQTFITPDRPLPGVMSLRRATLRLRVREGTMPALPSAGAQRFEMGEDGRSAVVRVDVDDPLPAGDADAALAEYIEPSAMIDSADEQVRALAQRAAQRAGESPSQRELAEAMRAYVHRYITRKSLDTAFASASETARMRTGDCSEHAVLLAAMLRAGGMPARVASGLVYADAFAGERAIFGWHMWTQALIDGRWIDLDATLPVTYHAGHVLTNTSSLAEGVLGGEMASMMTLMGNLEIEIVEPAHDGDQD
jgi:transglutaminase-like putative cysteine protease